MTLRANSVGGVAEAAVNIYPCSYLCLLLLYALDIALQVVVDEMLKFIGLSYHVGRSANRNFTPSILTQLSYCYSFSKQDNHLL
jgi:hypothetical protein